MGDRIVAWIEGTLHRLRLMDDTSSIDQRTELLGRGIGLDSIDVLQIVAAVEEDFDLTVDDDDLRAEDFQTVGTLATFIRDRLPPP